MPPPNDDRIFDIILKAIEEVRSRLGRVEIKVEVQATKLTMICGLAGFIGGLGGAYIIKLVH